MTDEPRAKQKTRWSFFAALILTAMLAFGVAGQWWIGRPKHAAERFISLLADNRFEEARAMMADKDSLQFEANGDLTVTATDKTTVTLPAGGRRLMSGGPNTPPATESLPGGSYDFDVTAFLVDTATSQEYAIELHGVAIGAKISINSLIDSSFQTSNAVNRSGLLGDYHPSPPGYGRRYAAIGSVTILSLLKGTSLWNQDPPP